MQTLTIPMRCSKTGGAFTVTFVRQSSSARFRIDAITRPDPSEEMLALLVGERANGRAASAPSRGARPDAITHDASSVDWTGWYCPHCQHGSTPGARTRFVQCSGCGELVCGGSVRDLGSGRATFWCHESCGHSGTLGSDHIESYTGSSGVTRPSLPAATTRKAIAAAPVRTALPTPAKGLLKR